MRKAFTLAEVLITIGVIGVVAALTIPSLSANYQKRVLTTQLQKAYAEISQAGAMVMAEDMGGDFRNSPIVRKGKFLEKFLKTTSIGTDSFPKTYKMDGNDYNLVNEISGSSHSCGKLTSGAYVCFNNAGGGILDVNGPKGPNQIGKDAFSIGFNKDGSLDEEYSVYLENIIHHDWDIDKYNDWNW